MDFNSNKWQIVGFRANGSGSSLNQLVVELKNEPESSFDASKNLRWDTAWI